MSRGGPDFTLNSAVIIFVRLAIGTRRYGLRSHEHLSGGEVEQERRAGRVVEGDLNRVALWRGQPPSASARRWPVAGRTARASAGARGGVACMQRLSGTGGAGEDFAGRSNSTHDRDDRRQQEHAARARRRMRLRRAAPALAAGGSCQV